MDKVQKQLLDSYFRKREIATGDYSYGMFGESGGIMPYELLELISSNRVNPKKVSGNNISELLKYDPKLYNNEKFIPYLEKMSLANISNLIQHRPEFIDIIDERYIDRLQSDSISLIIQKNPNLINRFNLNQMKISDITKLLVKQPQFIGIFEASINKMADGWTKDMFWRDLHGLGLRDENDSAKQYKIFLDAMVKYPQYRILFKDKLKKDHYDVVDLLKRDYSLLEYFSLSNLEGYDIYYLLKSFPNLITSLSSEQLNSLEELWLGWLLKDQPNLKLYFDKAKQNG